MRVRIGTSGYSYAAWKGRFYPASLPGSRMLDYYAARFDAVEINSSFYRLPSTATLATWATQTPPDFRFVLKGPRRVTHAADFPVPAAIADFLGRARDLHGRLGAVLFQLARPRDVAALARCAAMIPVGVRAAFEFRDPSWFEPDVFAILRAAGCALCITDADDGCTPWVATANWLYLRLRRQRYDECELAAWAARIRAMPSDEAYVFFRHEDEARGIDYAARLRALL